MYVHAGQGREETPSDARPSLPAGHIERGVALESETKPSSCRGGYQPWFGQ